MFPFIFFYAMYVHCTVPLLLFNRSKDQNIYIKKMASFANPTLQSLQPFMRRVAAKLNKNQNWTDNRVHELNAARTTTIRGLCQRLHAAVHLRGRFVLFLASSQLSGVSIHIRH